MTDIEIKEIVLKQSAADLGCRPEDFLSAENVIVRSVKNDGARKYLDLPFECNLVTYGNNVVASVSERLYEPVKKYISSFEAFRCFETPALQVFDRFLKENGLSVCFMAEYFLPDMKSFKVLPCAFRTRLLTKREFSHLYTPEWSNALCEKRKSLDMLAAAAYDGEKLVGLAGASADCENMWQIGVDVLPEYRRRGIASALTTILAQAILSCGKVPFYCAAWSNIKSVRNAIKCGFRPSWVELTAKDVAFVDKLNKNLLL